MLIGKISTDMTSRGPSAIAELLVACCILVHLADYVTFTDQFNTDSEHVSQALLCLSKTLLY